jgi:hypothetical protein
MTKLWGIKPTTNASLQAPLVLCRELLAANNAVRRRINAERECHARGFSAKDLRITDLYIDLPSHSGIGSARPTAVPWNRETPK